MHFVFWTYLQLSSCAPPRHQRVLIMCFIIIVLLTATILSLMLIRLKLGFIVIWLNAWVIQTIIAHSLSVTFLSFFVAVFLSFLVFPRHKPVDRLNHRWIRTFGLRFPFDFRCTWRKSSFIVLLLLLNHWLYCSENLRKNNLFQWKIRKLGF